jgi:hypothetical protein
MGDMSDVTIRDILEANPYGITRPGLVAWARLRIDPEFDDDRLTAELSALGGAVTEADGFVTLTPVGAGTPAPGWSDDPGSALPRAEPRTEAPIGWGSGPDSSADGRSTGIEGRPSPVAGPAAIDGWEAPPRAVPRRWLWAIAGLAIVAVIALQVVGSWARSVPAPTLAPGGQRLDASALSPGVCHQTPGSGTFYDVEVRDCATPHDAEVYAVVDHPAVGDAPYPGDDIIDRFVQTVCGPAFILYTGLDPRSQTELAQEWYGPTEEGWAGGDRQVVCYFTSASGEPLTHSYRVQP